jgi:hypothetical protein
MAQLQAPKATSPDCKAANGLQRKELHPTQPLLWAPSTPDPLSAAPRARPAAQAWRRISFPAEHASLLEEPAALELMEKSRLVELQVHTERELFTIVFLTPDEKEGRYAGCVACKICG